MKRIHITLGRNPAIEYDVALGLGRFAAEQEPQWEVEWGVELDDELLRAKGPFHAAVAWTLNEREQACVRRAEIPVVVTSRTAARHARFTALADDFEIGRMAADYFDGKGYREVLFVGLDLPYAAERFRGFREHFSGRIAQFTIKGGYQWHRRGDAKRFISKVLRCSRPLALFCDNDLQAASAMAVLAASGFRIPRDCAVLGVGDDEFAAMRSPVPISTVDPGWERVGYAAGRLIRDLLEDGTRRKGSVLVPPVGVLSRRSTEHFATADPVVLAAVRLIQSEACAGLEVDAVIRASGVSRRTLERRFRKAFGRGIDMEIRRHRLAVAEEFLRNSAKRVSEISELAGFSSLFHFSNAFKRRHGVSPIAYRKVHQINS